MPHREAGHGQGEHPNGHHCFCSFHNICQDKGQVLPDDLAVGRLLAVPPPPEIDIWAIDRHQKTVRTLVRHHRRFFVGGWASVSLAIKFKVVDVMYTKVVFTLSKDIKCNNPETPDL